MSEEVILDSPLERARGVIGRYPAPDEQYRFEYDDVDDRHVHMVGVRRPLQVTFRARGEFIFRTVLKPWTGIASARADTVIEERPPKKHK